MSSAGHIQNVVRALQRARAGARAMLLGQRALFILAALLAALLLIGAIDYFLRLPEWIRSINLLLGLGAVGVLVFRLLGPAWRFRPSLTEVALRIERQRPELRGLLASAVEFHHNAKAKAPEARSEMERALEQSVVSSAAGKWSIADASILRPRRLINSVLRLAVVVAAIAVVAVIRPDLASIGASRALAPWSDAEWPKRTGVADVTDITVHPHGAALPLRAAITRTPRDPDSTYLSVQYRLIDDANRSGPVRTALMTHQRRTVEIPTALQRPGATRGALFERLVEADASAVEYRFRTTDDETPWRRVDIVPPPAVLAARAVITPPDYAARLRAQDDGAGALVAPTEVDLGAGLDERATAPAALAGSRVVFTLDLNKPLAAPSSSPGDVAWLAATLGPDAPLAGLDISADGARWTIEWTLAETVRFPIALVDEHGIESIDEPVFRFEAALDAPASATVVEPATDESVLATAVIDLLGEGRDDVGLEAVWLEQQVARPAGAAEPSVPGGALEPDGDPVTLARLEAPGERLGRVEHSLDLSTLGVAPGDEVWITAVALDILASETGAREASRSAIRRLRIISESDFIEDIRAELSAVRQAAIRADEQQTEALTRTAERRADRPTRTAQTQIGERLARQSETLQRLSEAVERNALSDPTLSDLLQEARAAMTEAGASSDRAARALDEAAAEARNENPGADEALTEEKSREVRADQERVRDELARLIESLDAGQDTWVSRREIEGLLAEQRALREKTEQTGARTAGQDASQLSPQDKSDLEQIVEAQQELAEQARRLSEELPERAEAIEQQDPAAAAGLQKAGQRAREEQLSEKQQQAAQAAQENRTSDASRAQRQAEQTLEQMLEEIQRDERAKQEQLRRALASLIESIEALIGAQEMELANLDAAAQAAEPLAPLDAAMIRLNRNTLGVADDARTAGRELIGVVRLLTRAADAQTRAVGALRAAPAEHPAVRIEEQESLDRLRDARAEAEQLDEQQQQMEQARQKAELAAAYRALLERQTAVRDGVRPLAQIPELDRRERASARELAADQTSVRKDLEALTAGLDELEEAKVIEYTHRVLDEAAARAADALADGRAAPALPDTERAVVYIQALIDVLREDQQEQNPFAEAGGEGQAGGGQSGAGQQPLLPPIAELKMLRFLQTQVMAETRIASEAPAGADPQSLDRLGRAQRELVELGEGLIRRLQPGGGTPDVQPIPGPEPETGDPAPEGPPASSDEPESGERSPEPSPESNPEADQTEQFHGGAF